jgi:hypothetical protein
MIAQETGSTQFTSSVMMEWPELDLPETEKQRDGQCECEDGGTERSASSRAGRWSDSTSPVQIHARTHGAGHRRHEDETLFQRVGLVNAALGSPRPCANSAPPQ